MHGSKRTSIYWAIPRAIPLNIRRQPPPPIEELDILQGKIIFSPEIPSEVSQFYYGILNSLGLGVLNSSRVK